MSGPPKLGKFEIRRELAKGAMGVVYEGYDPMIDRVVALKTILPENLHGGDAGELLARFRREAQAAGRLTHPNIVGIYDFGEEGGTHFIAMEFVKGRSLQDMLERDERFAVPDVVRIMSQLLEALDYSHRNGVVHRDIKPSNIIILPDGTVKIADFGIARIESSNLTQAGLLIGTPNYMSPEQFRGQTVDGRSDLFSAGVILYQLLTGERPFTGSVTTVMQKVLQEEPLPPSGLNEQVPRAFDEVMQRALAKRPDERYQTAREFADAIRRAAAAPAPGDAAVLDPDATLAPADTAPRMIRPPAAAQPATDVQRTAATSVTPLSSPSPLGPAATATRKSRVLPIAGVVAGVAALVAVGWFAAGRLGDAGNADAPARATSPVATPARPIASTSPVPVHAVSAPEGTIVVTALGLVDPTDARYQGDQAALQADLRADSRGQVVEKAIGLYLQQASLSEHYERLRDKVLARSGDYIATIVQESAPKLGKDGLMSVTTQAIVKSRELQKSLNQMSREERIDFIRNNGDPKVAVRVTTRDADRSDAAPQLSAVAENVLKERIRSFGFRTWSEEPAADKAADFSVIGEARIKKLSAKLPASGLTVSKYTLTSWTVKCVERATGEEIYFNNTLPKGVGSWASEEEALRAIGGKLADEFSRDFFLQNFGLSGQKVVLKVTGLADANAAALLALELIGLRPVLSVTPRPGISPRAYDLILAGGGSPLELVANGILKPLNAKLGAACFSLGTSAGEVVEVLLTPGCAEKSVLTRLEAAPPAGLLAAPPARLRSVVKNPETLKNLTLQDHAPDGRRDVA